LRRIDRLVWGDALRIPFDRLAAAIDLTPSTAPTLKYAHTAAQRDKGADTSSSASAPNRRHRARSRALDRIGRLYGIEAEIRGQLADERCRVRQARAGPDLESLHTWLHTTLTTLSKKSELAVAIRYTLANWTALTRYRDDGRLEVDNNAAERALRAVALGRKNWLFAGSDDGGERAAAIYTLLGTAKLNELNPEAYLRYVLERIADHPINRIEELLPWNLARQTPCLRLAA
jgi:hypothetical protein